MQRTVRYPSYFLVMALVGLLAAFAGFARTFFIPMAAGKFQAPPAIHIHGAFAFAWIILFLVQSSLIHVRKHRMHRSLGVLGAFVALGVAVTMVPAGIFQVEKDLKLGLGETAYSALLGIFTSGILFLSLVSAGIVQRNKPAAHKRYLLLATIVVLWPAWFRFRHYFPSVPNPEIWFALVLADSLIIFAWIWEKYRFKKIHPVLLYGGLFVILEQSLEVVLYDSTNWQRFSKWLFHLLV